MIRQYTEIDRVESTRFTANIEYTPEGAEEPITVLVSPSREHVSVHLSGIGAKRVVAKQTSANAATLHIAKPEDLKVKSVVVEAEPRSRGDRTTTYKIGDWENCTSINTIMEKAGVKPRSGRKYRITIEEL